MFCRSAMLCVFLLFSSVSLRAQSMPEHVQKSLDKIAGTWEITTNIDDRKVTERVTLEWVNGKNAMVYHGEGENFQTGAKTRFSGILGWDSAQQRVEESGFDTSGGTFKANHKISDSKWIGKMTAASTVDGVQNLETATREFVFDDKDNWEIVCTDRVLDGVEKGARKLRFRRLEDSGDASQSVPCPWEWMLGDWKVERSDGTSADVNWRFPEGGGDYVFGTWKESDGTVLHEIVGWEADRRQLVAHAYGTNGAYFAVRFQDVQKHRMSGFLRARSADGESQVGVLEVERLSDGKSTSRFISSDGTVLTETLLKVKK